MYDDSKSAAFRYRVRYAECTAHGELALAGYINLFSEAVAQALGERGLLLRTVTARAGGLREAGYVVEIQASPTYDDEVDVDVQLQSLDDHGFTFGCQMRVARGGKALATGSLHYEARTSGPDGAGKLPPDLYQRLRDWAA
jgi:acyl-CoA thioesterase FadM